MVTVAVCGGNVNNARFVFITSSISIFKTKNNNMNCDFPGVFLRAGPQQLARLRLHLQGGQQSAVDVPRIPGDARIGESIRGGTGSRGR